MKFKKNMKKGFTLVELIVVIAIVAILAAVSVVSYLAFINSANESADIQLVKQLNTCLQADEALHGKKDWSSDYKGMTDLLESNGFIVENLTKTKSGCDMVYQGSDSQGNIINRYALLRGDDVLYSETTFDKESNYRNFWIPETAEEAQDLSEEGKGVVLGDELGEIIEEFEAHGSVIVNGAKVSSIKYLNLDSDENKEVVICTNGGNLTVDAANDTVYHFGSLNEADVQNIAEDSYHEFGSVNLLKVGNGHVEIEDNSFVLKATGNMTNVTISTNAQVLQKNDDPATSLKISSTKQMELFRDSANAGITFEGLTVELTENITLNDGWTPINGFMGTFDGKEHTISNLNAKGISVNGTYNFGLFGEISSCCDIKNIVFKNSNINIVNTGANDTAVNVGFVTGYVTSSPNFEGITIESSCSINVTSKVCAGGLVGRWKKGNSDVSEIANCTNKASFVLNDNQTNQSAKAAGLVGYADNDATISLRFNNCVNTGDITATSNTTVYIAGIVTTARWQGIILGEATEKTTYTPYLGGNQVTDVKYTNNCINTGDLTATAPTKDLSVLILATSGGLELNNADEYWYAETIRRADDTHEGFQGFIPAQSALTKEFSYNNKDYTIGVLSTSENTISLTIE